MSGIIVSLGRNSRKSKCNSQGASRGALAKGGAEIHKWCDKVGRVFEGHRGALRQPRWGQGKHPGEGDTRDELEKTSRVSSGKLRQVERDTLGRQNSKSMIRMERRTCWEHADHSCWTVISWGQRPALRAPP